MPMTTWKRPQLTKNEKNQLRKTHEGIGAHENIRRENSPPERRRRKQEDKSTTC